MKRIEIFFGEMGSGKSYHAQRHALHMGFGFLEGDDLVSPEMARLVKQFKPLTRALVRGLVTRLVEEIKLRVLDVDGLVVAQALYLDEDRRWIDSELCRAGYDVRWHWVRVSLLQNARQLWSRPRGTRWVIYWLLNKPFFQDPIKS